MLSDFEDSGADVRSSRRPSPRPLTGNTRVLLVASACLNAGLTALHAASDAGHLGAARLLLRSRARRLEKVAQGL